MLPVSMCEPYPCCRAGSEDWGVMTGCWRAPPACSEPLLDPVVAASRKRRIERDSETLSSLLSGIRSCMMRVREDCHSLLVAASCPSLVPASSKGCSGEWFVDEGSNARVQESVAHLMRCCLYMYNSLEEGLNYLEDPSVSVADVNRTLQEVDVMNALLYTTSPVLVNGSGLQMLGEPLHMLQSALLVMRQEMGEPESKHGCNWQRRVLEFGERSALPRARF